MNNYPIDRSQPAFGKAFIFLALFACCIVVPPALSHSAEDTLFINFQNPPESAGPRTWWHWTAGNVTLDGITKDLEWMQRVGIAGFQLADVSFGAGQSVDDKVLFGAPEWLAAVRHAAEEADRLHLEMAIFSSAGWSLTGGPWVKPEQAMKKLVWSDTLVHGHQLFTGKLSHPPFNNSPIGNMERGRRPKQPADPTYYNDIAVLAYRAPASLSNMRLLKPKTTSHTGPIDATAMLDNDLNSGVTIKAPQTGEPAWIQFEFETSFQARAFTISGDNGVPVGRLLASDDGTNFRAVVTLPGAQLYRQGWVRTFAFPEMSAKFYRLEIIGAPLGPAETMNQTSAKPVSEYVLYEAILHSVPRIHRWEEKVGFRHLFEYESVPTPAIPTELAIQHENLIDLTSKMDENGTLNWDVPEGDWNILRMGYSLTGAKNRPAMPTGLGFEVDKLSAEHTEAYIRDYMKPIAAALDSLYGKSLRYILLDSWEAGMQNWTDNMLAEFQKRRGYHATSFLPALAGRVVVSAEVSDRFLWDFRRTLADMFAENHYGAIADFLRKQGIGTYGEASGVSLEILEDALLCKKFMDIPMGEFWVRALHPERMYYEDIRGAASAAHVYGKKIVAAEAFTGGGYEAPFTLKKVADYWFCQGVNRLVFHTSAHQPFDTKPGNTMVGTHLHRNITWAEQAKPFIDYLARASFMLQQGQFVADIVYLLNEGAPATMPIWGAGLAPKPPDGYDYDYINTDVLLNRVSVNANGDLLLPDGMMYRILVLPPIDRMTLPVIQKIKNLVENGATVVGPKPLASPSLEQYPNADSEIQTLAAALWGDLDGISRTSRRIGKGRVIWGLPLSDVLTSMYIPKDVEYSQALDMDLFWTHRRTSSVDIYFAVNSSDRAHDIDIRFRVTEKTPELWFPDTGERRSAIYTTIDSLTTVSLTLPQHGSVFIVFRETAPEPAPILQKEFKTILKTVNGSWELNFPPNLGAPDKIQLEQLKSWTECTDTGVKYFSGAAVYNKTINAPADWFQNDAKLILDLGKALDVAEVSINGKVAGTRWKPPYTFDITNILKPGANRFEIKITSQWTNRLVGDVNAPADKKILPVGSEKIFFFRTPPLQESGLIGPVTIISTKTE
ncbi:glycoside hydrolase [candidate division KSB1 bacterium]|nr:glycoside hydrolase [candidate division KSB1 bacterium]